MTAKDFLRQLARKDAHIDALIQRQQHYYELAARRTPVYRADGSGGTAAAAAARNTFARRWTWDGRSTGASMSTWT